MKWFRDGGVTLIAMSATLVIFVFLRTEGGQLLTPETSVVFLGGLAVLLSLAIGFFSMAEQEEIIDLLKEISKKLGKA
jgi:hypothetical protein